MKKILLNGCSFVAGDALTWNTHYHDIDWMKHIFYRKLHPVYTSKQVQQFYLNYKDNLRGKDNLSGQLNKILNVDVVDISEDGNSNDAITVKTISYLEKLSAEERKNYHVCVGWTEFTRRMVWMSNFNTFFSLHNSHLNNSTFEDRHQFIKEVIVNSPDQDHYTNFFNNVFFLQCYLKLNNISYTFWRSLGNSSSMFTTSDDSIAIKNMHLRHDKILNKEDWISFDNEEYPWLGKVWWDILSENKHTINNENLHPNLEGVIQFSNRIAPKIKPLVQ